MPAWTSSRGASGSPTAGSTTARGPRSWPGCGNCSRPSRSPPVKEGVSGLLDAIEESRKRQADLSSVLRENVRQAIEFLLEDVSAANRTNSGLFHAPGPNPERQPALTDAQAHEALYQATVRVVMRLVVCLFAESRPELLLNGPDLRPVLRRPHRSTSGWRRPSGTRAASTRCSTSTRPGPG